MKRIATLSALGCLGVLIAVMNAAPIQATAPSGAGGTPPIRATIAPYHFDSDSYKIFQKDPQDVVMRQIFISPGGSTGWHFHPGPTFVVVIQGTLSFYVGDDSTCTAARYTAGQGFVETPGEVHIARNEGTDTVIAQVTFLDVPVGGAFRLDAPDPGNCPF